MEENIKDVAKPFDEDDVNYDSLYDMGVNFFRVYYIQNEIHRDDFIDDEEGWFFIYRLLRCDFTEELFPDEIRKEFIRLRRLANKLMKLEEMAFVSKEEMKKYADRFTLGWDDFAEQPFFRDSDFDWESYAGGRDLRVTWKENENGEVEEASCDERDEISAPDPYKFRKDFAKWIPYMELAMFGGDIDWEELSETLTDPYMKNLAKRISDPDLPYEEYESLVKEFKENMEYQYTDRYVGNAIFDNSFERFNREFSGDDTAAVLVEILGDAEDGGYYRVAWDIIADSLADFPMARMYCLLAAHSQTLLDREYVVHSGEIVVYLLQQHLANCTRAEEAAEALKNETADRDDKIEMEYFSPNYQKKSFLIVSDRDEFDFIKDYIQDDFDEVSIYDKNYPYEGSDEEKIEYARKNYGIEDEDLYVREDSIVKHLHIDKNPDAENDYYESFKNAVECTYGKRYADELVTDKNGDVEFWLDCEGLEVR